MAEHISERCGEQIAALKGNIARVIQGKDDAIDLLLMSLFSGGSVLMEDVPGVGKTTLAKALAKSIDAAFNRIQFTPDLLPADIVGASIYNPQTGAFVFREGPAFCNVLPADEINSVSSYCSCCWCKSPLPAFCPRLAPSQR